MMFALLAAERGILSSSNGPPGMACISAKTNTEMISSVPRIAAILEAT